MKRDMINNESCPFSAKNNILTGEIVKYSYDGTSDDFGDCIPKIEYFNKDNDRSYIDEV